MNTWWSDFKQQGGLSARSAPAAAPPHAGAPAANASGALVLPLGPYEATDSVLGEGGYAKVVLGRHRDTGDKVAIKLLDTRESTTSGSGRSASSEAAIVREVAALRRAGQHANVCELLGYYRLGEDCHAMVMEMCGGGELFRLVERFGAMEEAKILPLFAGVLAGVQHLHAQGIAHRDLKLENILLARCEKDGTAKGWTPKICDLGLAHAHARGADGKGWAERELTQFCGSRSYCAPEVMARLGYNGYTADVWSLGVCLFGLVSGFFPVDEASNRDWRFERIARQQHVAPHTSTTVAIFGFYSRPCPLSAALVQLLDGMLQVAPSKRWRLPDVAASAWVHGRPLPAAPPPVAPPPPPSLEIDICDPLGGGTEVYRSGADLPPTAGAAPPKLARQRAEISLVGL